MERLSDQVGEVYTFTEKIAGSRRLRWCDSHSLRQDAYEVRKARAVPEQLLVVKIVWIVDSALTMSVDLEAIDDSKA